MSITNLISYELLGPKEEFAGWVSNISPYDTPFTSLTGKAKVYNRVFEWQTDRLDLVHAKNAWAESKEDLPNPMHIATKVHNNYTQIFRKVVNVSDTAEAFSAHGRPSELEYQIEKATKEIKRDLEWTFLSSQDKDEGSTNNNTRLMSGFYHLVAATDEAEPNTGAVTHKRLTTDTFTEDDIFDITENLYYAGARANVVMFHPTHAPLFSKFFENTDDRVSLYTNTDSEVPNHLTKFTDPLGQEFTLLPNRYMGKGLLYFFHPHDWFQRVLRTPTISQLDKTGSSESWMLEMEVSLQHRNPWASGILELSTYTGGIDYNITLNSHAPFYAGHPDQMSYISTPTPPLSVSWVSNDTNIATVDQNGLVTPLKLGNATIIVTGTYPYGIVKASSVQIEVLGIKIDMTGDYDMVKTRNFDLKYITTVASTATPTDTWTSDPAIRLYINNSTNKGDPHIPGEGRLDVTVTYPGIGDFTDSMNFTVSGFNMYPNTFPSMKVGDSVVITEDYFHSYPDTFNPTGQYLFTPNAAADGTKVSIAETQDATGKYIYTATANAIGSAVHFRVNTVSDPTVKRDFYFNVTA